MMLANKANGANSPRTRSQILQNHSTPLSSQDANSLNRANRFNRKNSKKRKLLAKSEEVIDLTPKKYKYSSSDSDVEFIEPEPPTVIDLVADETINCNSFTNVNGCADDASTTNSNENKNSANIDLNLIVTSSDSMEIADNSIEPPNVMETTLPTVQPVEPVLLYVRDSVGGGSLQTPLYDLVSDDSFCFDSPYGTPNGSQSKTLVNDDSVIFVSETIKTTPKVNFPAEEFIPINSKRFFNKMLKNATSQGKVQNKRSPTRLQNKNLHPNDSGESSPNPKPISGIKRMVLIDGNNVAYSHSRNKEFSVEGIDICLKYFTEKGYDAKAIVPQMRLKKNRSTNQELLVKLESEGKVVFSPCKNLPNGKKVTSYDDRFILDFAVDYDAAVISNDNYRDLSKENEKYRDIINTRVIGFIFLNDIIRFPQDPYGKLGPSLNDILNGKVK